MAREVTQEDAEVKVNRTSVDVVVTGKSISYLVFRKHARFLSKNSNAQGQFGVDSSGVVSGGNGGQSGSASR